MNKFLVLSGMMCLFLFSCGTTAKQTKTSDPKPTAEEQAIASKEEVAALYSKIATEASVTLENKIYYLDQPIIISSKDNFTLDGNACTFIMKNKSKDVVIAEYCNSITLKNFKATHIEPEGPIGCTGSVVQVRNNTGVTIEKCQLNGSGIIGVVAYETKNLRVVDNYIYNNSQYGILYDTDSTVEVVGNKFEDNGPSGNQHVGKALNAMLSDVQLMEPNTKTEGLIMSKNTYK